MQKQLFADVVQNRSSEKLHNIYWETPMLKSLLNKVARLKACNFIKKRLKRRSFPMNVTKLLRAATLWTHLWWLVLTMHIFHKFAADIRSFLQRSI